MSHHELIGLELKVATVQRQELTGRLYAFDPGLNVMVIVQEHDNRRDYHFINADTVSQILVTDHTPVVLDSTLPSLDVKKMLERVESNISRETALMAKMNLDASSEAQFIFKELSKTYDCDWSGDAIVIRALGASLKPPYTSIVSREANSEHLSKVVRHRQLHHIRDKLKP
jgi:small nuclear ribonucleoprotein (snRNP)-like protein